MFEVFGVMSQSWEAMFDTNLFKDANSQLLAILCAYQAETVTCMLEHELRYKTYFRCWDVSGTCRIDAIHPPAPVYCGQELISKLQWWIC